MPDESESPARFATPTRPPSPSPERPPASSPTTPSTDSPPPSQSETGYQSAGARLRARADQLRSLAAGRQRPLGSPEGRGQAPRPTTSSRGSSEHNPRRVVDGLAVGIREVTKVLDAVLGRRLEDADLVATAEEAYSIAAPLAGYVLDRAESGPIASVVERAGLFGAVAAAGGWLLRAFVFRAPGGREEADELRERVVERMARAMHRKAPPATEDETAAPRSLDDMFGGSEPDD